MGCWFGHPAAGLQLLFTGCSVLLLDDEEEAGGWLDAENKGGGRAERWIWEDPDGDGEWVAAARWEKMDVTDPRTRVWAHIYR